MLFASARAAGEPGADRRDFLAIIPLKSGLLSARTARSSGVSPFLAICACGMGTEGGGAERKLSGLLLELIEELEAELFALVISDTAESGVGRLLILVQPTTGHAHAGELANKPTVKKRIN